MGNEGFWSRTRRIALEVVTTGGTRKFDVLRQEAQEADERLRAACREYEQLEVRMKFLAVSRGAANQLAHLRLVEVTEVVQKFGNARAVQVLTLSDQSCPAIAKMQKTIVDFNVAGRTDHWIRRWNCDNCGCLGGSVGPWSCFDGNCNQWLVGSRRNSCHVSLVWRRIFGDWRWRHGVRVLCNWPG